METQMKFAHAVLTGLFLIAPAGASAQGAAPTDPQIAHIVVTANQVDIDAGKLAESKGASKEVKDFGKHIGAQRQERGAERAHRQGAAGFRRTSRACEAGPVEARQGGLMSITRPPACLPGLVGEHSIRVAFALACAGLLSLCGDALGADR